MSTRFSLLGRLAAGVAHDLANYLAIVDMSLATARKRADEEGLRNAVDAAREGTDRASGLCRCLLDYARGGAPDPAPVDLEATVHRLLQLFGRMIPAHVSAVVDADADLPPVSGVAAELEQLVLNLVLNACDAMPDGGDLRVRLRATTRLVCLEVADTGGGMSQPELVRGALGPSTNARHPGAGLGLGIVHAVADRHHAGVHIENRPTGGTIVRVTFPRRAMTKPAVSA
jgi:signal transduction histidine kinase